MPKTYIRKATALEKTCVVLTATCLTFALSQQAASQSISQAIWQQSVPLQKSDNMGYMSDTFLDFAPPDRWQPFKPEERGLFRQHAWDVWVQTMQPLGEEFEAWAGWPMVRTWNTISQIMALADQTVASAPSAASPSEIVETHRFHSLARQFPNVESGSYNYRSIPTVDDFGTVQCAGYYSDMIGDGAFFQSNGDIMIPIESFSQPAFDYIKTNRLSSSDGLAGTEIDFPQGTVITKQMLWPIMRDQITVVPVWLVQSDSIWNNQFPESSNGLYSGYEMWDSVIGIAPPGVSPEPVDDYSYLFADLTPHNGAKPIKTPIKVLLEANDVYDLESFYFAPVSAKFLDHMSEADLALLNASSCFANGRQIQEGDYFLTVAMHVITKEVEPWTMQSAWLSTQGQSRDVIYSADRTSATSQGPALNYLMTESSNILEEDGSLAIAVNPYIEGVIHPLATSCRNCHTRASWPRKNTAFPDGATEQRHVANFPECYSLLSSLRLPNDPDISELEKQCYGWKAKMTDMSWSLADRVKSP